MVAGDGWLLARCSAGAQARPANTSPDSHESGHADRESAVTAKGENAGRHHEHG